MKVKFAILQDDDTDVNQADFLLQMDKMFYQVWCAKFFLNHI